MIPLKNSGRKGLKSVQYGKSGSSPQVQCTCMVHTSLEKSWNFNLAFKSHGIWCWLEKGHFAWKNNWKSVKVIGKYQFVEVGYFYIWLSCLLTMIFNSLVMPYGDRYGSTLAQVMACCLMAPSHYLNQCWLIISGIHLRTFSQEIPQPSITRISAVDKRSPSRQMRPITRSGDPTWPSKLPDGRPNSQ